MNNSKRNGKSSSVSYPRLNLKKTRAYTVRNRKNLVTIGNLAAPEEKSCLSNKFPEMDELADRIATARRNDKPVIWFMGAHVIKCGLSPYDNELLERNVITHIAGNGAVGIHDFELAFLGGTSEYVPTAIEDGTFGMWEETGKWMNEAIKKGFRRGLGYGESLAVYIQENISRFPYHDDCVLYRAYKKNIPVTYHVTIGTDSINQHPDADFSAAGGASGIDFSIFCDSISRMDGGVFLNFGSAVTGPEVFLKALSIARNQGYRTEKITTANFDIIPLGNYRSTQQKETFHYYYRPLKNIVNRPTSLGGKGFYIEGNHSETIPDLFTRLARKMHQQ